MEPVTHLLTGACLARTGLNRRTAYATMAMAIAAEFPDIDTLWGLRGPVSGFEHHRGITHTFLGVPFEAALLVFAFAIFHRFRRRRSDLHTHSQMSGQTAPARWGLLYLGVLLALLSHLLLDYTNNYGIRPFFPFHNAWYAGSIVFIFDPLIFVLLLAGLLLPSLFGLISREIGTQGERYRGRGWARAALALVLLLWGVRWTQHRRALALAESQTLRAPLVLAGSPGPPMADSDEPAPSQAQRPLLEAERVWASPDPLSIFRWYTVSDFGPAYTVGVADTRVETLVPDAILVKPAANPVLLAARASRLGRIYQDWSAMPLLRVTDGVPPGATPSDTGQTEGHTVTFTDLRFVGNLPLVGHGDRPPLSGQVSLDLKQHVLAQGIDGRFGR